MTHGRHYTGSARTVDPSTEWEKVASLSTPPQVIPEPARRAQAEGENT